jgi:NTE family protein
MPNLRDEIAAHGRFVLVLQGGGALGAYQVGVYQALHEAGIEPDWVVGTSIGAINAALIAGAPFAERMDRLRAFWERVEQGRFPGAPLPNWFGSALRNMLAVTSGIPAFFTPNPPAFMSPHAPLGAEAAGYYSVAPLAETLSEMIDFDRINAGPMRLTVGASNVRTSEMTYFDSRDMPLGLEHVMASGALPPAFPAVRIGDDLYWDGGILSNTPVEVVFDDCPRVSAMIFAVHLWNPHGPEPQTIWEVMNRHKDVQYSSRAASHIKRQRQLHRLRHVVSELAALVPAAARQSPDFAELAGFGCTTRMHVVRLLAPALDYEDHAKDLDFSPEGIAQRREAGYRHTCETLAKAPWRGDFDPLEGFVLHETCGGEMVETAAAAA